MLIENQKVQFQFKEEEEEENWSNLVLFFIGHEFGSLLYKINWFNLVIGWPQNQ